MQFGGIIKQICVNLPTPPDERCDDPAFALANPTICPVAPFLIIKPGSALTCVLGSIQYRAFLVSNGTETDVTSSTRFSTSDANVVVIGAISGNATGLSPGNAIITASYQGKTAHADLTIVAGSDCCANQEVSMMVLVDSSKSMSLNFGAGYASRLIFARAAATRFVNEVNNHKDIVGLMKFNALDNLVLSSPTSDKSAVAALVPSISQTQNKTTFYDALTTAIGELINSTQGLRVLVLISDGEDTSASYLTDNPIQLIDDFKQAGGIVICLGCRASGKGFTLLETLATGGFFINALPSNPSLALDYLSGLKGYICAGNCTPEGDVLIAGGALAYCGFQNWKVEGSVDLLGNGFFDLLPGNGLYVDLVGSGSGCSYSLPAPTALDWSQNGQPEDSGSYHGQANWFTTPFPEGSNGWRYRWSLDGLSWTEVDNLDESFHPQSASFAEGTAIYGQTALELDGEQVSPWSETQSVTGP